MFHSKSSSSQSFLWPSGRINPNHTLCWRRHVSNFVTSSWKHMFLLLLSSGFSKFLYLSTKCIFNHLDDVKKFRKGQPMQHASGKQRLHLRVADSTHYNLLVLCNEKKRQIKYIERALLSPLLSYNPYTSPL